MSDIENGSSATPSAILSRAEVSREVSAPGDPLYSMLTPDRPQQGSALKSKSLIIGIFIVVVIGVGIAIYFLLRGSDPNNDCKGKRKVRISDPAKMTPLEKMRVCRNPDPYIRKDNKGQWFCCDCSGADKRPGSQGKVCETPLDPTACASYYNQNDTSHFDSASSSTMCECSADWTTASTAGPDEKCVTRAYDCTRSTSNGLSGKGAPKAAWNKTHNTFSECQCQAAGKASFVPGYPPKCSCDAQYNLCSVRTTGSSGSQIVEATKSSNVDMCTCSNSLPYFTDVVKDGETLLVKPTGTPTADSTLGCRYPNVFSSGVYNNEGKWDCQCKDGTWASDQSGNKCSPSPSCIRPSDKTKAEFCSSKTMSKSQGWYCLCPHQCKLDQKSHQCVWKGDDNDPKPSLREHPARFL